MSRLESQPRSLEGKVEQMIGVVIALALFAGAAQFTVGYARADDAQNIATYLQYIAAVNRGDAAAALAMFTDDAQLVGLPPNCLTPCNGRAALQAQLNIEASIHLQLQLLSSAQASNGIVTAQVAHRADPIRQGGLSRVLTRDTVTFRGDKISRLVVDVDMSDGQSAAFVASLSASPPSQPAGSPGPAAPAVVLPPATGDAGLASAIQPSMLPGF